MSKLLIVSNRLPVTIEKRKGSLLFRQSAGGLVTGISSFYKAHNSIWLGWCGIPSDKLSKKEKKRIETKLIREHNCYPLFLSKRNIEKYYYGFFNKTLWPLFHCFNQYVIYDKALWQSYKKVNELFCDKLAEIAGPKDTIWIHDYHLMLLPKLIRQRLPNVKIGFFLHIPFPPFETFRLLPWRKEILEGVLDADLIGFHTYDYVWHFLFSVGRLLGYEHTLGQITAGNHILKVDSFPMGIDYKRFAKAVDDLRVQKEHSKIRNKVGSRKIILSIDRLDYTKGIIQRLEAFDSFLEKNPKYQKKVVFILVVVPSRTRVEHYRLLKKQVDEFVGKMNGKYGSIGWMPIWYLYSFLSFRNLVALYNAADVALITPLKDGMNLIAKEFIASKGDGRGVLILSERTGAAKELGEAIIVNPNNKEQICEALKDALTMPEQLQIEANRTMQRRLDRYNVQRWAGDFMDSLSNIKKIQKQLSARRLSFVGKRELFANYSKSKKRLIFLDYDGTLIAFGERPEKVKPDSELLKLLKTLASDRRNELVIISGREKKILEKWFACLDVRLIAEHGAWLKEKGNKWETIEPLKSDWKEKARPILELYADRTPGSFVEEKDFSLVWHYRRVDPELALVRARELKSALLHFTTNFNLQVLEGNKVLEVKRVGVNKGRAVLRWLEKKNWDFILAIGDDYTDEDVFAVLSEKAYSFKVGLLPSNARFNLNSVKEVRLLLKGLIRRQKDA
ncbi:MAG: bifunctional alpha,alpha-trehalose-phosphate synthase (UDP-forming)/trehalose-phosphatase [Candidatus Omnitrophica bacterium]|nr:bifunctional alpha,alpha-trehalose-phosphate synthase (UDP-forming)/trehalose-phosphatase [Candidatus Omnitrophota bacterium]